jgi:plasmid stability protein
MLLFVAYEVNYMANLTISVDDEVLKKARMRALEQGTSVNAVLREYLEAYAGVWQRQEEAIGNLLRLSLSAKSRRGGSKWTRDELHER